MAYRQFDEASKHWVGFTWAQVAAEVLRWQAALAKEGLAPGDRVAVMLKNSVEWVIFDQAALGLGLVTVPLYLDDRPDNAAYILDHADARLLLVEGKFQHKKLAEIAGSAHSLQRIVSLVPPENGLADWSARFAVAADWLAGAAGTTIPERHLSADLLASLVYTSGTTGRPKGVMLTHENLLWNAYYSSQCADFGPHEVFLSFLPMSHTLERTGGYYLPMLIGAEVAYARSIAQLAQDLQEIRPTVLSFRAAHLPAGAHAHSRQPGEEEIAAGGCSVSRCGWAGGVSSAVRGARCGRPSSCCGPCSRSWWRATSPRSSVAS